MSSIRTIAPIKGSLWGDRAFLLYFWGRTISIMGSAVTAVALPILVFQITGSALLTSLLAALEVISYLVFGLVAGAFADRVNRRRMMVGCDLLNAALLATVPVAALLGVLTLLHIYAIAILSATLFVWFDASNFGALPAIVGRTRIVAANSYTSSTATFLYIIGPAAGGALAATIGSALAIGIQGVTYTLSATLLLLIRRDMSANRSGPARTGSIVRKTLDDIGEGLRYLWAHRLVRSLTLLGI